MNLFDSADTAWYYFDMEPSPAGYGKHARNWTMNPYEAAARQKKAFALAARLHQFNITAEEAERMTIEQWRDLAKVTHTNAPSAETVKLAIEALRAMDRPKSTAEEIARTFRRCKA